MVAGRTEFFLLPSFVLVSTTLVTNYGSGKRRGTRINRPRIAIRVIGATPLRIGARLPNHAGTCHVTRIHPRIDKVMLGHGFARNDSMRTNRSLCRVSPTACRTGCSDTGNRLTGDRTTTTVTRLAMGHCIPLINAGCVDRRRCSRTVTSTHRTSTTIVTTGTAIRDTHVGLTCAGIATPVDKHVNGSAIARNTLIAGKRAARLTAIRRLSPVCISIARSDGSFVELGRSMRRKGLRGRGTADGMRLIVRGNRACPLGNALRFSSIAISRDANSVALHTIFPGPRRALLPNVFIHTQVSRNIRPSTVLVPRRNIDHAPHNSTAILVIGSGDRIRTHPIITDRTVNSG